MPNIKRRLTSLGTAIFETDHRASFQNNSFRSPANSLSRIYFPRIFAKNGLKPCLIFRYEYILKDKNITKTLSGLKSLIRGLRLRYRRSKNTRDLVKFSNAVLQNIVVFTVFKSLELLARVLTNAENKRGIRL